VVSVKYASTSATTRRASSVLRPVVRLTWSTSSSLGCVTSLITRTTLRVRAAEAKDLPEIGQILLFCQILT
jgi:hypothetical protein